MRADLCPIMGAMTIDARDIAGMVEHWLGCPPNGYLGSGYGSAILDLTHTPMNAPLADSVCAKLRADIALIGALPANTVNIYAQSQRPDKTTIFIEVAGTYVEAS